MLFKPVQLWENNEEKRFYIELIDIYTRLVNVYLEKNNINYEYQETDIRQELFDIGIIDDHTDIELLKQNISDKFQSFIEAVSYVKDHKTEIGNILDKLYNSKRRELQNNENNEPKIVDFFCGAGGLSLGFIQEGCKVVLANDIEEVCINTYKYNHPELSSDKVIKGDIKEIVDNVCDYIEDDVDIIVGGPPCQGFSEANRQRVIDDPRNKLYKYFVKAVEKIAPKFVVMENVKGMLKVANQVVEDYERLRVKNDLTYSVGYKVLNSQDFSVAQSRERLIYIAIRSDVAEAHHISPQSIFEEIEEQCKDNKVFTLNDALECIKPLDAPRIKNQNEVDSETTGKKIDVNNFSNNEYLNLINNNITPQFVFNHKARYVNDINYEIYKKLNPGDDATDEKIKDIMPYANRNHCFKDKYYKLIGDRPSRTITAHLRMDCHSHIHPRQIRAITPREAARVQSFPDDYMFLGPYLKTYMQIGNAVPVMMARGIARVICRYLNEGEDN